MFAYENPWILLENPRVGGSIPPPGTTFLANLLVSIGLKVASETSCSRVLVLRGASQVSCIDFKTARHEVTFA